MGYAEMPVRTLVGILAQIEAEREEFLTWQGYCEVNSPTFLTYRAEVVKLNEDISELTDVIRAKTDAEEAAAKAEKEETMGAGVEKYRKADGSYDMTDGQGAYAGTENVTVYRMHPDFGTFSVDGVRMVRVITGRPMVRHTVTAGGYRTLEEALSFAADVEATHDADRAEREMAAEDERLGRWLLEGRPVKETGTHRGQTRYGGYNRVSFVYVDTNESGSMPAGKFNGKIRCRRCGKGINSCKGHGAE